MEEGVSGHDFVTATLREMGICASIRTILIQKGYFVGSSFALTAATRFGWRARTPSRSTTTKARC